MAKTGIVSDLRFQDHRASGSHPESHHRLEVIREMLAEPGMKGTFAEIPPRPASTEELELVHTPRYVEFVASTAGRNYAMLDPDTYACPKSYETARLAAGGALEAADRVLSGEVANAFAFLRPPGHHAESGRAMGFCLFNNAAVAAAYALKKHRLDRILIIDWDLHHGNGTQNSFYGRSEVLYFSTHQFPYYPGSGSIGEVGEGSGKGFTVNVPLAPGPGDAEFLSLFEEILEPISLAYKPDLVLVSAGFDIYFQDPLGGMQVTPKGFGNLARIILEFAEKTCGGKVLFLLEGGYHLEGLRDSAREVLKTLKGEILTEGRDTSLRKSADRAMIGPVIRKVKEAHKPFWKLD